jgi:hypothetical protein
MIWAAIISGVTQLASSWMEERRTKIEVNKKLEEAKIERALRQDASEEDWNRLMAEGANSSWKDEYFVILLSVPAIMAFIPGMDTHVMNGFQVLKEMPEWYMYSFLTAIAASFGFRQLIKYK